MPTAAPPPPLPPSRRNGAGKHYRVCMHSVIGRHLTPCSCCCCHLAAGTQNFMLMASEADNGNLNGTQSDLLATWLGFCIRRLLFYIWMSCDDDGKGSRQPADRQAGHSQWQNWPKILSDFQTLYWIWALSLFHHHEWQASQKKQKFKRNLNLYDHKSTRFI